MKVHFCDSSASPCVHNLIVNANLDKALAATKRYVDAGHLIADRGASAVVAELGCIAWKFPILQFEHWVNCAHADHQKMAGRVMDAAVAEMLASSTELLRVVPPMIISSWAPR